MNYKKLLLFLVCLITGSTKPFVPLLPLTLGLSALPTIVKGAAEKKKVEEIQDTIRNIGVKVEKSLWCLIFIMFILSLCVGFITIGVFIARRRKKKTREFLCELEKLKGLVQFHDLGTQKEKEEVAKEFYKNAQHVFQKRKWEYAKQILGQRAELLVKLNDKNMLNNQLFSLLLQALIDGKQSSLV